MKPEALAALRPALESVEEIRRLALNQSKKIGGWTALAVGACLLLATFFRSGFPMQLAFVCLLAGAGFIAMERKKFAGRFKRDILGHVVKAYSSTLEYSPTGSLSRFDYENTRLFPKRVDSFRGEDLVTGVIGKTHVRFSEVHAQYKTESRGKKGRKRTSHHTIFKGLLFLADFNKHFSGSTHVFPDVAERLLGRLGSSMQAMSKSHGELVKLEDPDFERAFAVYSTDPTEARYILSPALMRRILDFQKRTKLSLNIAFKDSLVALAIPMGRNLFEPRLTKSMLDAGVLDEFWAELELLAGIVEELNLNNRIWTKR